LRAERKQALEDARRAREFLAHASHEIRTPLHGVVGYTSLLLGTELNDEQRALADALRAGVDSLLDVVNDVLDLSRLDAGALSLEPQEFDVIQLVQAVARQFAAVAWTKGLDLRVDTAGVTCPILVGDPGRLRQVLANLVANAVKFTDAGSVTIEAGSRPVRSRRRADGARCELRLSVADTGPGVPREDQGRLFRPFSRLTPAGGSRQPGAGLGLAISKQLVELMDGRLSYTPGAQGGSVFEFVIQVDEATTSIARERRDPDSTTPRVYVADDDPLSRRELLTALMAEQLVVAGSGPASGLRAALHAADAAERLPDAVLVGHVHEPEGDLGVAARIASDARLSRMPLVLAPVSGLRGHAPAVHRAGYSAYLPRPFRGGELQQCIRAVIRRPGSIPARDADSAGLADRGVRLVTRHRLADEQRIATAGRVLIADDDPASLMVTRLQVERLGYPVDTVENGGQAVTAASLRSYHVVLMDCGMPGVDGLAACAEIRRMRHERRPAIVAITAHAGAEWKRRCLLAGMDHVIEKPVRTHVLAGILNQYARTSRDAMLDTPAASTSSRVSSPRLSGAIDNLVADVGLELTLELAREYAAAVTRAIETVGSGDVTAIRHDAHRLLGSARTLGLPDFELLWLKVEELANADRYVPDAIREELRRACADLEGWIERHHEKHCA
jgi:CheY-like chemotaxis protein